MGFDIQSLIPQERTGIEDAFVARAGDGGTDRVGGRIKNQNRRNRHVHVLLETGQQPASPFTALRKHLDLWPGQGQEH